MNPAVDARRFIIDCLASRRPDRRTRIDEALIQGVDWEIVESLATTERVAPLLFSILRSRSVLPEELSDRFHHNYSIVGMRNALRINEMRLILEILSTAGIEIILLKGIALVERVYGNVALRPMTDVDLLVRRSQVQSALEQFQSLGYRREGVELSQDSNLEFENDIVLRKTDQPEFVVELHWSLFNSPYYQQRIAEDTLWANVEAMSLDGISAKALSPEHELLHLCGHLMLHHRGVGLLWWNDIAELIDHNHDRLDWDRLLVEAENLSVVLPLQAIMPEITERWAASVPQDFLNRLAALVPQEEEERVYEQLTAENRPPAQRLLADLRGMPERRMRARFLYQNLFPSAAYMDERYGISRPCMRPIYYLMRWQKGIVELVVKKR